MYCINISIISMYSINIYIKAIKRSGGRVVKVSAIQPRGRGIKPYILIRHLFWFWFQEVDLRVIYISCDNLYHNRANK